MKTKLLPRVVAGKALVTAAVLALTVPGVAFANTVSVTVKSPGATAGPTTTFSEISTHADCSSGLVSGGGIEQAIGTGPASPGNHVMGTEPSPDGNTGGLEVSSDTMSAPVRINDNSGSGLLPEDLVPEFEGNQVGAPLRCAGNTPTLQQSGNTVDGPHNGQCR